jgi:hypothetical protein
MSWWKHRAEKSFTHRHLCEFTGLDMEMAIDRHYGEAMDVIDRLFVYMFSGLNSRCSARIRLFSMAQCCMFLCCLSWLWWVSPAAVACKPCAAL